MSTDFIKKHYKMPAIFAGVFIVLTVSGIGCPFRFLTGLPCPSCGATRSYLYLARLDFEMAFRGHPLFPVLLPGVLILLFAKQPLFGSAKRQKIFIAAFGGLIISFWVFRLIFLQNDIFYIDFSRGYVVELYNAVKSAVF